MGEVVCPICEEAFRSAVDHHPNLVCEACDERAVTAADEAPAHGFEAVEHGPGPAGDARGPEPQTGSNPVFIDGRKCWRRYRFGGWVTMADPHDCASYEEFWERVVVPADEADDDAAAADRD